MTITSDLFEILKLKSDVEYKLNEHDIITFDFGEIYEGGKWCPRPGEFNLYCYPGWRINAEGIRTSSAYYDPRKLPLQEIADKINQRVLKRQKQVKEGKAEFARRRNRVRSSARMEENLINSFVGDLSPEELTLFKGKLEGKVSAQSVEKVAITLTLTPEEAVEVVRFIRGRHVNETA